MGQAFFTMQEDAYEMTREEFIKTYGNQNAEVYDQLWEMNNGPDFDPETDQTS